MGGREESWLSSCNWKLPKVSGWDSRSSPSAPGSHFEKTVVEDRCDKPQGRKGLWKTALHLYFAHTHTYTESLVQQKTKEWSLFTILRQYAYDSIPQRAVCEISVQKDRSEYKKKVPSRQYCRVNQQNEEQNSKGKNSFNIPSGSLFLYSVMTLACRAA